MVIAVSKAVEEYLQPLIQNHEVAPGHIFQLYFGVLDWKQDARIQEEVLSHQISNEQRKRDPDKEKIKGLEARKKCCQSLIASNDQDPAGALNLLREYMAKFPKTDDESRKASLKHIPQIDCVTLAELPSGAQSLHILTALRDRQATVAPTGSWLKEATLTSPLTTGIGREHPTENGFAFLDPYGLPYLPGSSVKGVLRRAAEELALFEDGEKKGGWTLPAVWWLFGFDENASYFSKPPHSGADGGQGQEDPVEKERQAWAQAGIEHAAGLDSGQDSVTKQAFLSFFKVALGAEKFHKTFGKDHDCLSIFNKLQKDQVLRGSIHMRGSLDFWDVFPHLDKGKLRIDILNPHHKDYYGGTGVPGTFENPEPHYFLTVPPGSKLRFIVGPNFLPGLSDALKGKWRQLLESALDHAGKWLGFGAKTSVGYGRLVRRKEAAAQETEIWENATLTWLPGPRQLNARCGQKAGFTKDPMVTAQIPESFKNKWKKGRAVTATVKVKGYLIVALMLEDN